MNILEILRAGLKRMLVLKLPSWPYLAAAAALALLGHFLSEIEILEPLRAFTTQTLADLRVISPLNVIGTYYYHLTGCAVTFVDGSVSGNCDYSATVGEQMSRYGLTGFKTIFWPIAMLLQTAIEVWEQSGWVGRIVYLLTLPVGGFIAMGVVDMLGKDDDWTIIGSILVAALLPLTAGLVALLLQGVLIVFLWVFGKALAAIVWVITFAAGPLTFANHAMKVVKEARELEEGSAGAKHKE